MERPTGIGNLVWGTLTAADPGLFGTIAIPELVKNNGSKTGGVLGCSLKINVPVATTVSDDDADDGPLRLSLSGSISSRGMMTGDVSTVIRVDDSQMRVRSFIWTGALQ
jgi:hypothetical protein